MEFLFLLLILFLPPTISHAQSQCLELFTLSRSQIADTEGVQGLKHYTSFENLVLILQSGTLKSAAELEATEAYGARDVNVFLELILESSIGSSLNPAFSSSFRRKNSLEIYSLDKVLLIFNTDVLNRSDYHLSPDWSYGQKFYGGAKASEPTEIKNYLRALNQKPSRNEVVFYNEVSLKDLREIWIHPLRHRELIELLQIRGVDSLWGKPIELFIRPVERVPENSRPS